METIQVVSTNAQSITLITEINRQAVLLSSSLHNMRDILRANNQKPIPTPKHNWSKRTMNECELLRERLDTLLGTIATVFSMKAHEYNVPIRISTDNAKRVLQDCTGWMEVGTEYGLEAMLSLYEGMLRTFVTSLCSEEAERVTYQQAYEYFEKSYRLSMLLSNDE